MNQITKVQMQLDRIEMMIRMNQDQIYTAMRCLDISLDIKNEIILRNANEIKQLKIEKDLIINRGLRSLDNDSRDS